MKWGNSDAVGFVSCISGKQDLGFQNPASVVIHLFILFYALYSFTLLDCIFNSTLKGWKEGGFLKFQG